ncbi:hypothetical protein P691DRAFT_503810 [Macrolepiota fuliginosa MF-IS2]|uniref:Uncharacterized protein n=1 Tax=Macrolepiota fuliginosa MF-IS2 TaxID=1400762 RepID=A0A9P6BXZ9_9AGAR|nr:hypothetical protein P691DRAFT_503810 [Macrolepiota fuliginosa MF-IS2]
MGLKKQVWNWLKGRLPSPRQPREQAQPSAHSDDPGPLTASSHPEPPTIKVMASSGGSAAPVTDDVYRHGYSEEGTDHTQVPTPTSSQATHLPQPGHGSHLESPMIMATAPPEQPATLLIEGAEPHLGSIGQSPGATSTSPLVEAWEGEEARGRLEVPMSVSPRTNSRSSSRQGVIDMLCHY